MEIHITGSDSRGLFIVLLLSFHLPQVRYCLKTLRAQMAARKNQNQNHHHRKVGELRRAP